MTLIAPPEPTDADNIKDCIDTGRLMVEEALEDLAELRDGKPTKHHKSYMGREYDEAYLQGRKDACRILLLSFGVNDLPNSTSRGR